MQYNFINNGKNNLSKNVSKDDEGIFLDYSSSSKYFWIYNKITMTIEEFVHDTFDESNSKNVVKESVENLAYILGRSL